MNYLLPFPIFFTGLNISKMVSPYNNSIRLKVKQNARPLKVILETVSSLYILRYYEYLNRKAMHIVFCKALNSLKEAVSMSCSERK